MVCQILGLLSCSSRCDCSYFFPPNGCVADGFLLFRAVKYLLPVPVCFYRVAGISLPCLFVGAWRYPPRAASAGEVCGPLLLVTEGVGHRACLEQGAPTVFSVGFHSHSQMSPVLLAEPLGELTNPTKGRGKWSLCSSVQHRAISEDVHLSLFRP